MSARDHVRQAFSRLPPGVRRQVLHGLGRYAPWEPQFDFTPPPLSPGEVSGPPDFVGIGVQKAGTTWWYELMLAHPEIASHPDIHKERHFFDRFGARSMQPSDIEQYFGWFPRPRGSMTGEWTPDYLAYPWVPALLERAAPDTRLLVLLRDPVERFRSGLAHDQRMGTPRDGDSIAAAVQRGFYKRALDGWLEHFDREQFLILQHERCVVDRDRQLDLTFAHLGLSPHRPPGPPSVPEVPRSPREALPADLTRQLVDLYTDDVAALATWLPDLDLTLWPHFAYMVGADGRSEPAGGSNSPTARP